MMFSGNDIIHDAKFCGKTMLGKIDDDLRVKLEFISTHIASQYDAVRATIINRSEGVVDKQVFKFADIIGQYQRPGRESLDPHMWEYNNKPEWYTPITQSQKASIAGNVLRYIEMYQDQTMVGPTM